MGNYENKLIANREEKLNKLVSLGVNPYNNETKYREKTPINQVLSCQRDGEQFRIAGRIISKNNRGKLKFFFLQDQTGKIQLMFSKNDLKEKDWEIVGCIEVGDIIGVEGHTHTTKTGEYSLFITSVSWMTKSMAIPPEKHHKIKDEEILRRQRYLDLIYTEGSTNKLLARSKLISNLRKYLDEKGYYEVETPMLQPLAGGAAARPFSTHHNALDQDFYLRIALELHLKRLLVGGVEKIYEIGRVFRNEGIDQNHNPEFTMLELYESYGDYNSMENLLHDCIFHIAKSMPGYNKHFKSEVQYIPASLNGRSAIIAPEPSTGFKYDKITFADAIYKELGIKLGKDDIPIKDILGEDIKQKEGWITYCHVGDYSDYYVAANQIFDKIIQPKLIKPTIVYNYPSQICPLTKRCEDDPRFAERFEFFVNGMEIANAYTELNDPKIQEENFRKQLLELPEEEQMGKMDTDFIEALKVGMPPAGGIGIGIDRLCMLLLDCESIRDVIAFPTLKKKDENDER